MAGAWQPYRDYKAAASKAKSRTHRAKSSRVGRRARVRMVNAPKKLF
jgi:hypothetical protein